MYRAYFPFRLILKHIKISSRILFIGEDLNKLYLKKFFFGCTVVFLETSIKKFETKKIIINAHFRSINKQKSYDVVVVLAPFSLINSDTFDKIFTNIKPGALMIFSEYFFDKLIFKNLVEELDQFIRGVRLRYYLHYEFLNLLKQKHLRIIGSSKGKFIHNYKYQQFQKDGFKKGEFFPYLNTWEALAKSISNKTFVANDNNSIFLLRQYINVVTIKC